MSDHKFFAKCDGCKKKKFHVARRSVPVPQLGAEVMAKSQAHICDGCFDKLKSKLDNTQ